MVPIFTVTAFINVAITTTCVFFLTPFDMFISGFAQNCPQIVVKLSSTVISMFLHKWMTPEVACYFKKKETILKPRH